MFSTTTTLRKARLADKPDDFGDSQDLAHLETASASQKVRARQLLQHMRQLLFYFSLIVLCPLGIFCALKLFVFEKIYGLNPIIGAAVGTVIVMHVFLAAYIFRLIALQDSSTDKREASDECVDLQAQDKGALAIVLLLVFYCLWIVLFPIITFFMLKFIVLETNKNTDIISAICTVIAMHMALAFYINRANSSANAANCKID